MGIFINYDYPGNVRELKNTIDRMVVLSENHVITTEGIPILYNLKRISPVSSYPTNELVSWKEFKRRSEREYLEWPSARPAGISAPPPGS